MTLMASSKPLPKTKAPPPRSRTELRPAFRTAPSAKAHLHARLSALTLLAQDSPHLFASPLGPFFHRGQPAELPRFVFFGPHASGNSGRIACFAGFDQADRRAAHALLDFTEQLRRNPEDGAALDLSLFPMVNAAGFFLDAPPRPLATMHWGRSDAPEIKLLEKDIRQRGYDGFIRIQTVPDGDDEASLRVRAPAGTFLAIDAQFLALEKAEHPLRVERGGLAAGGPLTIADDLAAPPFELTLRLPGNWSDARYLQTARALLGRLLARYRSFRAVSSGPL